jgi:GR25 family glycosyltransferase involved in LPS biosynthesis
MKIFVIHYKKLINRKLFILSQFKKYNIQNYEFIEIDRDELYNHDISMFQKNYNNSQIAISLSHFYAYKQISDKYNNGLIFEDDVILNNNFINILHKYMNQLPTNYDMLFIGNGCNLHIEKHKLISNKNIYEKCLYPTNWGGNGASRCCDSYIISKKCANTLCKYINNLKYKINLPIDWWLNVAARDNIFKVYWAEPTIVTQGTQNGLFITSH